MEIDFVVIVVLCEVQREQDTEEQGGINVACPWRKMGSVSDDGKTMWRVTSMLGAACKPGKALTKAD